MSTTTTTISAAPLPAWVTVREAATVIGVSGGRVRQMIADNTIGQRDRRMFGIQWQIRRSRAEYLRDNPPPTRWPRGKPRPTASP